MLIQTVTASYSATSGMEANGKGICPIPFKDQNWFIIVHNKIGDPRHQTYTICTTPISNNTFDIAAKPVHAGTSNFLCIGFWK